MRIECAHNKLVKLSDLRPHPSNRNKHSEAQIKALAKIIAQNGQRSPIVVSNQSDYITKGNGRYEAIKLLGWESCAVDYQNYRDELEELRDRIADNEIGRYSEFDKNGFISDLENSGLQLDELDLEEFGLIDFNIPEIKIDPEDFEDKGDKINSESFYSSIKKEVGRINREAIFNGNDEIDSILKIESYFLNILLETGWVDIENSISK